MDGGYSLFDTPVTGEALTIFNKAFEGMGGAGVIPLAVSTQVTSGTNYRYLSILRTGGSPGSITDEPAMVYISQPIEGNAPDPKIITLVEQK